MTTENFVGLVNQPNQASGQDVQTDAAGQSRARQALIRRVWLVDAYLWIALGINLAVIAAEQYFGVLSGATVLMGEVPALLLALALILGGAALLLNSWGDFMRYMATRTAAPKVKPAVAARPAFAQDTPSIEPGWTVRNTARQYRSSRIRNIEGGIA